MGPTSVVGASSIKTGATVSKTQRKESKFVKLKEYIDKSGRQFIIPTIREAQVFAKEAGLGLTNTEVSNFLRENFSQYAETNFNSQRIKYPMRVAAASLGSLGIDLAWFGKTKAFKEYGVISPPLYCFLTGVCLLSRQVFIIPVPRGKSFAHLKEPLETLIGSYKQAKGVSVTSISSDKERALTSTACQNFFRQRGIKHFTYELSSRKNSVAENANKLIRQEWTRFLALDSGLKDKDIAKKIEANINRRYIVYQNGKQSSFTRQGVTKRTVQRFLRDCEKKQSGNFWSFVRINPDFLRFKFQLGDHVRLFTKLTDISNPAIKRSEKSLLSRVYVVTKQAAYIRGGYVCPYYLVKPVTSQEPGSKSYVVYPQAMQKVTKMTPSTGAAAPAAAGVL